MVRGHREGEITEHAKALLEAFSQNAGVKAGGYAGVGARGAPPVDLLVKRGFLSNRSLLRIFYEAAKWVVSA
ncbi:hypothetical protein DCC25_05640 [Auritidibacter sp. NML120636]|nr:hypothetical protein DCC25_05640 [Auritidibacter sp. NML120636]